MRRIAAPLAPVNEVCTYAAQCGSQLRSRSLEPRQSSCCSGKSTNRTARSTSSTAGCTRCPREHERPAAADHLAAAQPVPPVGLHAIPICATGDPVAFGVGRRRAVFEVTRVDAVASRPTEDHVAALPRPDRIVTPVAYETVVSAACLEIVTPPTSDHDVVGALSRQDAPAVPWRDQAIVARTALGEDTVIAKRATGGQSCRCRRHSRHSEKRPGLAR
jgi:hypothetical protein